MRSRIFTILLTHNLHARERGRPSAELLEMRTCAHLSPTVSLSFVKTLQQRSLYCVMCRTIPPFFFFFFFFSLFFSFAYPDNFFFLKEEIKRGWSRSINELALEYFIVARCFARFLPLFFSQTSEVFYLAIDPGLSLS